MGVVLVKRTTVIYRCRDFLRPTAFFTACALAAIACVGATQIKAEPSQSQPNSTTTSWTESHELAAQHSSEHQIIKMRVTAYCPCEKCCGEYSDGVTACGHRIQPGDAFVAADKNYAFGTQMSIPGYNNNQPVKVLDRGGAIRGDRLDVFFHSHEEALQWGVKHLDVKVHRSS